MDGWGSERKGMETKERKCIGVKERRENERNMVVFIGYDKWDKSEWEGG